MSSAATYRDGDTIVAPATAPGVGALAVVRVSGPESISLADRLFRGGTAPSSATPRTVLHGEAIHGDGSAIDEVLLTCFRAPHSYTGEDSVEISCHGAPFLVSRIVDAYISCGARPAAPGEFTRRAFRNGRIDLAQAESVADLIRARTAGAAKAALRQLRGTLSDKLGELRESIVSAQADIEADLDFSAEEDVPSYDRGAVLKMVRLAARDLESLIARGEAGRIVRDGVRVVLTGKPNSGKSTLFNALVEEDRAIVSDEPGTTRDVLDGEIELDGILFTLSDTAGLRAVGGSQVEDEGIRRAKKRKADADIVVILVDRSEPLDEEDRQRLTRTADRRRIVALTKSDLDDRVGEVPAGEEEVVAVSALQGAGMDELRRALIRVALGGSGTGAAGAAESPVTSARHLGALRRALQAMKSAEEMVNEGELLAEDLRAASSALGEITGEGAPEELLDRIFSSFCIGK